MNGSVLEQTAVCTTPYNL